MNGRRAATLKRFAQLALDCVHREYPNQVALRMTSDADLRPPHELTPAFYGCYDWHSAVHGHWLLARVARMLPEFEAEALPVLGQTLTHEKLQMERAYVEARPGFERPYGLAWLLTLHAELSTWRHPDAERWAENLEPLAAVCKAHLSTWLPKLSHPNRTGTHSQTAFALGFVLDAARKTHDAETESIICEQARRLHGEDYTYATHLEPSGEDFLSPSLGAADLMRRVLEADEFAAWFDRVLPDGVSMVPARVSDPSDGRIAHLDGLNLSRAWMLRALSAALAGHPQRAQLAELAAVHSDTGLNAVDGAHYAGSHWLGTFAVYMLTAGGS